MAEFRRGGGIETMLDGKKIDWRPRPKCSNVAEFNFGAENENLPKKRVYFANFYPKLLIEFFFSYEIFGNNITMKLAEHFEELQYWQIIFWIVLQFSALPGCVSCHRAWSRAFKNCGFFFYIMPFMAKF